MIARSAPLGLLCITACAAARAEATVRIAVCQARLRWYADAADFTAATRMLVVAAAQQHPDLIVFPEDYGTPLVALGLPVGPPLSSLGEAASALAGAELDAQARKWGASQTRAVFLLQGPRMRDAYLSTFSALAREFRVTIAAGSICLPAGGGPGVYNTTFLLGPDGAVIGEQRKVNLIDLEGPEGLDLSHGSRDDLRVFDTPLGRIALCICLDCFDADIGRRLADLGAQIVVDPSANPKLFTPEEEAQNRTGLWARVQEHGYIGVQCFAVGEFLGLPFRGRSWVIRPGEVLAQAQSDDREEVVVAKVAP